MSDENDLDRDFIEKRGKTRHKALHDVRVEVDGEVVVGKTEDISLSGVAVSSLVDITTEQFVRLHLEKLGELTGQVVREFEDGFAVEFDTIEDSGSVLENKLKTMMGVDKKDKAGGDVSDERAAMEAQLKAMMGGGGDDNE